MSLTILLEALDRVASGDDLTEEEFETITWTCDDSVLDEVANRAWLDLRRFVDDADIRSRDRDYERSLRTGLREWHQELTGLQQGLDPFHRRKSWFVRLAWRLGIRR